MGIAIADLSPVSCTYSTALAKHVVSRSHGERVSDTSGCIVSLANHCESDPAGMPRVAMHIVSVCVCKCAFVCVLVCVSMCVCTCVSVNKSPEIPGPDSHTALRANLPPIRCLP